MRFVVPLLCLSLLATVLGFQLLGWQGSLYASVVFLSGFFILQWKFINGGGRILIGAALVAIVAALVWKEDTQIVLKALARATMFASFLVSMVFLRVAAKNSALINKVSHLLINQKPSVRYGMLSYGSVVMGVILSFGTINLVGQMINQGNTLEAAGGNQRVQDIRRKRMSLALHRGFSTIPMASPFSITIALILASIPGLNWTKLVPLSFTLAMILLGVGWMLDFATHRNLPSRPSFPLETGLSWRPAFEFMLLVVILFCMAALLSRFLSGQLPLAIMICAPIFALVWLYMTQRQAGSFLNTLKNDLSEGLGRLHSEVAVIAAASLVGVILSSFLKQEQLAAFVSYTGLTGMLLAFAAMCAIPLFAILGIGPLITVTFIATTLSSTPVFEISSYVLALSLLGGWALALNIAPITLSAVMVGAVTGCTPKNLTFDWNTVYCVLGVIVSFSFVLFLASVGVIR
ncbi:hypothetical protein [Terasakiella pusilla]|uniref:hypothetical protein n=1 Tax=Terasakiella pusilla TaxID=64973 RepID=UPI003AA7E735